MPCAWAATAGANRTAVAAIHGARMVILFFMTFTSARKEATSALKIVLNALNNYGSCAVVQSRFHDGRRDRLQPKSSRSEDADARVARRCSATTNRDRPLPEQGLDPGEDERCRRERREQDEPGYLHPRRHPRELGFEELDVIGDHVHVGAGRADLTQRERVFKSHEHVLAEGG